MPTYQYACKECDHRFEQVQAFSDHALTECPRCQGSLRKVYGSVGVVFKGSGFYRTDSRSGPTASSPAEHHSDGSSDGAAAGSGSDGSSGSSGESGAAASSNGGPGSTNGSSNGKANGGSGSAGSKGSSNGKPQTTSSSGSSKTASAAAR